MLVALMGCTQDDAVSVPLAQTFRDTDAQIASQTNVTADRMAGGWVIRQRFEAQNGPFTDMALAAMSDGGLQLFVPTVTCEDEVCFEKNVPITLAPTGPGRWTPVGPQAYLSPAELWVMWMGFDSRTAAIGTPSGEFGWIMDKNPTGGGDRIIAARDIMDWFGYDVARLTTVNSGVE
jgi:apolipoprotein D and lipocalin family protein